MTMTNLNIARTSQSLSPGNRVELFTLDLAPLQDYIAAEDYPAGGKLYFSPSSIGEDLIVFNNKTYLSVPIDAKGFEVSGRGSLPQPTLQIANINNLAGGLAATFQDLVGAILTRTVTFRQFLDDGATPDVNAKFPETIWEVVQKVKQNKIYMEWKMASFLDREGEELPKRKVWKNTCLWNYRKWDKTANAGAGGFDYSNVDGCDWTGATYYREDDTLTTLGQEDVCAKTLKACKLRFGDAAVLPFGGFIGVNAR